MLQQRGTFGPINVVRPFLIVGVRAVPEPREQVELQVVVGIDQARQDQVILKINLRGRDLRWKLRGIRRYHCAYAAALDVNVRADSRSCVHRNASP
jgi:hypothetical protein